MTQSSESDKWRSDKAGAEIVLSNLSGDEVTVNFPSGGSARMKPVHNSNAALTLLQIASTGSPDSIVLQKDTGIFVRAYSSVMIDGWAFGGYQVGACK